MRFPLVVCVFVCLEVTALPLFAQSPNGNINGLVSDPSGAAVADAEVVAVNDLTHMGYRTKTNGEGIYALPNLPSGSYGLQISKIGFKTLIKRDITLNVQDSLSINFTLLVGAFHEIVTVQGGVPLVNTQSAAVSTVVDETYVKNMPLNGRSFQDLILLTPGIVTQSPQAGAQLGQEGEFSVNGQRTESNSYTVDGVSANVGAAAGINMLAGGGPSGSVPVATALGTTQALVSVDDLQEFRVQSSSYSAEYGRNPGGQLAFETKSGTNQLHGTAYNYLRNDFFDANDWFNNYFGIKEPALRQNDFGGTLGGPISIPGVYKGRDKTFFFVSYEGLRLTAPQAATTNFVPDATLRETAPAPLNQVLNAFPIPNGLDLGDGIAQYIGSWSNPSSLNSTSVRLDHSANDRLKLFFRFSDTTSNSKTRETLLINNGTPSSRDISAYTARTYTAGADSVLSDRFSNELRLNYSSNGVIESTVFDSIGGSTPVDLAKLSGVDAQYADVGLVYDGYYIQLQQQQLSGDQGQWNLVDTTRFSLGRHRFEFGVDYRRLASVAILPTPAVLFFYFDEPSVDTNNANTYAAAEAPAYPLYKNFSAFAQDEWRVGSKFTLSLGLRWEENPPPGVTQGLKPYTVSLQASSPGAWSLAPYGTRLWNTTWYNFAPRLGVAYIVHDTPGLETVFRAGGGVFFDTGQQLGSEGFQGPGFEAISSSAGSFPAPPSGGIPVIQNPPLPPYQNFPYGFAPHLQLPYTLQWNASLEQTLGKAQALTISHVGSHASRLLQKNEFAPANNPNASEFIFVENGLTSDYDSLQVQFRRRLSQGFTALASYTWSHCLDYGSSNFVFGYERGNCDFDVRNGLSAAFSYDLPAVGHDAYAHAALHHWGLDGRFSARSSFPVTLYGQTLLQPNLQVYDGGLNLVPNQPVYLYGTNCDSILQGLGDLSPGQRCPGGRAINPNAFTLATSGYGDAPRNFARGFRAAEIDIAVRREFPIYENLKLQFRMEAFNVLNHPNFGQVGSNFGSSTFGHATATLASSLGVLSPLYQQGGPRSMQFALKLIF